MVKKTVHYKANKCVDDSGYNQHQCLLEEYRNGIEKLGLDCISPWGHSILVSTHQNHSCNESELEAEYKFSSNFFITAARNELEACKGKFIH